MQNIFKKILISLCLSLVVFLIFFVFTHKNLAPVNKVFVVEKGQGIREIASNLKKEGLIENDFILIAYSFITGNNKKLQSGYYELSSDMSIAKIVEKISSGDVAREKITIIEGWNLRDIIDYLNSRKSFQNEEVAKILQEGSVDSDFLREKPINASLEGYIFPDTYIINKGESFEDFLNITLNNFDEKLSEELRTEIKKQGKSFHEILIMASLIEKEVKTYEDKQLVSGILWKRLAIGMPLQIDSTITYLTDKNSTRVSVEETRIDSPYNTYLNKGLPFGPICNPGLESIKAAIYPKNNEYLFYLSTPEGKTIFSKNLTEHNIAKAKYLK